MNTLQSSSLQDLLRRYKTLQSTISNLVSSDDIYAHFPCEIEGIQGSLHSFFIGELCASIKAKHIQSIKYSQTGRYTSPSQSFCASELDAVLIVPTEKEAQEILSDLYTVFTDSSGTLWAEIFLLPWWGMVPYRPVAKGAVIFGERSSVLAKLSDPSRINPYSNAALKPRIYIITQRALQTPVPPPSYIQSLLFSLKTGQIFDPVSLSEVLITNGYIRVPRVTVKGEFTLRGEVLDIFMPGEEYAHRIVFDFDTVSQIKLFDSETQSSVDNLTELLIYPMKEVIWTDAVIEQTEAQILKNLNKYSIDFNKSDEEKEAGKRRLLEGFESFFNQLRQFREYEGEELFYSAIFDKKYTVLDYLHPSVSLFYMDYDRLDNAQEGFDREYSGLYKRAWSSFEQGLSMPVPPPQEILVSFRSLINLHEKRILFRSIHGSQVLEHERISFDCDPPKSFFGNINYLKESLEALLQDAWTIIIYAESDNQALRISELLRDFIERISIIPQSITSGFGIPECKVLIIQENEIFGRRKHVPRSVKHAKSAVIDTFVELNPGDYVVHVNYGIGLFKGIERVKALGNERDYIKLEYAEQETVFIPIEQVNLVQRYIGNEGDNPRLDRLGSKSWENRKNKVKKSVEDIAQKLIDLYSKRKAARGFPFPKDGEWQTAFEAAFPYTETDDQITVASEVKADMEKPVPMDRLVCGDVGYGKTEMAMRAAFKAVMGGKQVAFLAPTTILAEQHYESCLDRFEKFPVRIAHMSRFVSKSDQKKILEKLKTGEVDILIGTHRIIQKDIIFKDLGLMIIDEEQRFGVKDKERLKELKTNIDSLAMSATPIPRTLHMSLLKIRDMSLLATPPQNRQSIETVIDAYNEDRVANAIRREVERGGQIFYLHNRVESLDEVRLKLQRIVPEMLIDCAHGQMSATDLDDIFRRFKMGGFHILVATTIIENGIDIPNVNTIIIDRADMYGVSQLYQLRGRVGRSDRKAYAYLLYPEGKALSEIAMKRLQVISDFTELGSGFKIAMKDMEIRGAGNLLGKDQSGDVYSVGFDLYLRLLEEAVKRLSDENYEEENEVLLELEYTGFIPDTYVQNAQTKMELYKKIASVGSREEMERVYNELSDRFGPIPDEVSSLLALSEIKVICRKLSITTLKERNGTVQIEFAKVSKVAVDKVIRLIKESAGRIKLDPARPNILLLMTGKIGLKEKSEFIREKLETLV